MPDNDTEIVIGRGQSVSILFPNGIPEFQTQAQYEINGNWIYINQETFDFSLNFTFQQEPFIMQEPIIDPNTAADWALTGGKLSLLKWKVTLPVANSTVQVWKPSDGDIAAFVWEAGLPIVRESCYLLADSENYLEGMSGEVSIPSTVQSVLIESQEDYELVLWFAQMKIKLTNGTIIAAKPFNGSGGGVVEKLPQ